MPGEELAPGDYAVLVCFRLNETPIPIANLAACETGECAGCKVEIVFSRLGEEIVIAEAVRLGLPVRRLCVSCVPPVMMANLVCPCGCGRKFGESLAEAIRFRREHQADA